MLRVKTYLDKSPIHGIGVFAAQEIAEGTLIWEFNPQIDKILEIHSTEFLKNELDREFITKYAFFDRQLKKWVLSVDNDRFTNHSDTPNTYALSTSEVVALRDIHAGEEITINYFEIDSLVNDKLFGLSNNKK